MSNSESGKLAGKLAGRFIVIDGPDGAGKGTQLALLAEHLSGEGGQVVNVHDPGDTAAGDLIRRILLAPNGAPLEVTTETLLFMASRAQLVAEKIRPALAAGQIVLCDRFISATCAYQGARGADIAAIIELGRFAVGETWPDVTIVLDLPAEEGLKRIGLKAGRSASRSAARAGESVMQGMLFRDAVADSMESRSLAFHRRVVELFRSLPAAYPRPVVLVDATGEPAAVHQRILEALGRVDL